MRVVVGLVCACALAAPSTSRAEAAEPWIFASVAPEGSTTDLAINAFIKDLERIAGGRLRLKKRAGVADESTSLDQCARGKIQVWGGSLGVLAHRVPSLGVLELPYLFPDVETLLASQVGAAMRRGKVDAQLRGAGLVALDVAFIGWRSISSRERPIRVPEDVRGLNARSQGAALHLAMWRTLGASIRTLELGELGPALAAGKVDVFDVPPAFLFATSSARHTRYHTRTRHMMQLGTIVFNRRAWDGLPERVREGILGLVPGFPRAASHAHEKDDREHLANLEKAGLQVSDPAPEAANLWRVALRPLQREALKSGGPAAVELWRAIRDRQERAASAGR